jgi:NAD(P)-dependent dehydrogenase (short-subunit alcohol dehydrogenase family)
MLAGVTMNMVTPIELIQRVIDPMADRGFGRIVNITSIGEKMPLDGLDLSSGARAGLTAFVAGVARSVADRNVTINNLLPGYFDTDASARGSSRRQSARGVLRTTSLHNGRPPCRPSASATCLSSGTCALFFAARTQVISPARTYGWMALIPRVF